ncbi:hypothetical protein SKAU_G00005460 [Synaphobranchus kaupii]|uniref:Uncharacterized protein n=1 Tax=Synaphobranchus kaupii TaxID=118154 RepID=A0A9Q1JBM7_SYNKA|nr:hypothetical protein SKAU_G00005460 [Synaphobranchus kaupii]
MIQLCTARSDPSRLRGLVVRDVEPGGGYTYRVLTVSKRAESEPSPALTHKLGMAYCGDGRIQRSLGEQCDDMNSANGDGCSSQCRKEPFFNCVGVGESWNFGELRPNSLCTQPPLSPSISELNELLGLEAQVNPST